MFRLEAEDPENRIFLFYFIFKKELGELLACRVHDTVRAQVPSYGGTGLQTSLVEPKKLMPCTFVVLDSQEPIRAASLHLAERGPRSQSFRGTRGTRV